MANYIPFVRSSYFKVKDVAAFKAWAEGLGLEVAERGILCGFMRDDDGGIPCDRYNEATEEHEDIDFAKELSSHLAEGWVANWREIGYEKMRYFVGVAEAVNAKGEGKIISINEIYDWCKDEGEFTPAEY